MSITSGKKCLLLISLCTLGALSVAEENPTPPRSPSIQQSAKLTVADNGVITVTVSPTDYTAVKALASASQSWTDYVGVYPSVLGTAHSFQPAFLLQLLNARKNVTIHDESQGTDTSTDFSTPYTRALIRQLWTTLPPAHGLAGLVNDDCRFFLSVGLTTGSIKTGANDVSNESSVFVGVGYSVNPYFTFNAGLLASISGTGNSTQRLAIGFSMDPAVIGGIFK